MKHLFLAAAVLMLTSLGVAHAQDIPTAYHTGQTQVGVAYTNAATDEFSDRIGGISVYGTFDFLPHIGAEGAVHILKLQNPQLYSQSTYEGGLRYFRSYNRLSPYLRMMIGVGSYDLKPSPGGAYKEFSGSYGMFSGGGGVDYRINRQFSARGDFEYQYWYGYPPHVLNPSLISVGVAYHIR